MHAADPTQYIKPVTREKNLAADLADLAKRDSLGNDSLGNDLTPRTPEERELVRILLRGIRKFRAAGIEIGHEWITLRRPPRSGAQEFKIEIHVSHFD